MKYLLVIAIVLSLLTAGASLRGIKSCTAALEQLTTSSAEASTAVLSGDISDSKATFRLILELSIGSALLTALCLIITLVSSSRSRRAGETHSAHVIQAAQRFHGG